jgi:hypothetical protein
MSKKPGWHELPTRGDTKGVWVHRRKHCDCERNDRHFQQTHNQQFTMEQVVTLLDECTEVVKKELQHSLQNTKNNAVAEAHLYTDLVTKELRNQLDAKFGEMVGFRSSTRNLLKNGTSPKTTPAIQEN